MAAPYHFPPIDRLSDDKSYSPFTNALYVSETKERLENLFVSFGMNVKIVDCYSNKYRILLKLQLNGKLTPNSIRKIKKDIEVASDGNYVDFMDGRDGQSITIAIKNVQRPSIPLKEVICGAAFKESKSKLSVAAGTNLFAGDLIIDLASLPNLIVLGVTGAGKSNFLNVIILSVLYKARPDEVKLAMIDTKGVDLPLLNGIPHMEFNAARDAVEGLKVLKWLINESIERLSLMKQKKAETLDEYNQYAKEKKPRYLLIIDEYADFKDNCKENVDELIISIAKYSEKTGIHIVLATQSARKEHLSQEIKDTIPSRACLVVADKRELQIALDRTGERVLAGNGDMIFTRNENDPGVRLQAALASDEDVDSVAAYLNREQMIDLESVSEGDQ